ncbi:universal stress protein [Actinomadura sp. 3N508]|uniref:universal stress protein n=1 Tax=Actinomadura sp. 3N508 TaxID=3375153 RepID=UPI003787700D
MPPSSVHTWIEMRTMTPFPSTCRIVVGVDGSPASLRALRWAAAEAALRHAELVAVRAWRARREWVPPYAAANRRPSPERERERTRHALAADVRAVLGPDPTVRVRQELAFGEAATALLDRAATADLLVLGGHRSGSASTAAVGPVRTACLRRSVCPVVLVPPGVVRGGGAPDGGRERPAGEGRRASAPVTLAPAAHTGDDGPWRHEGRKEHATGPYPRRVPWPAEHGEGRQGHLH